MRPGIFLLMLFASLFITAPVYSQEVNDKGKTILNHIAVYVQDLQKRTHFYSSVIGLDTIPEPFHDGRHTWYKIGPQSQLHLIFVLVFHPLKTLFQHSEKTILNSRIGLVKKMKLPSELMV